MCPPLAQVTHSTSSGQAPANPRVYVSGASTLLFALLFCLLSACEGGNAEVREVVEVDRARPLRPLVHAETGLYDVEHADEVEAYMLSHYQKTGAIPAPQQAEAGTGEEDAESIIETELGDEAETDPGIGDFKTPAALGRAVFEAVILQDEARFKKLVINPAELKTMTGVKETTASKRYAALVDKAMLSFALFSPGNSSEEPAEGLAGMLEFVEVREGKAGTLQGKTPRRNEETVQYWGTTVVFKLRPEYTSGSPTEFSITLGRLLRTSDNTWKLASNLSVSSNFSQYLQAGLHLKPELLAPEHHSFPLSVGDFWRYQVSRPDGGVDGMQSPEVASPAKEEIRIEVDAVHKHQGYRLVLLNRKSTEDDKAEKLAYLVTARRLYSCGRYCRSRAGRLSYVLEYFRERAPLLIFPPELNARWGPGGTLVKTGGKYYTNESLEVTSVPAGDFSNTVVINQKGRSSSWTRHFKPGVGIVKRAIRDRSGTRFEELVEYRILSAE